MEFLSGGKQTQNLSLEQNSKRPTPFSWGSFARLGGLVKCTSLSLGLSLSLSLRCMAAVFLLSLLNPTVSPADGDIELPELCDPQAPQIKKIENHVDEVGGVLQKFLSQVESRKSTSRDPRPTLNEYVIALELASLHPLYAEEVALFEEKARNAGQVGWVRRLEELRHPRNALTYQFRELNSERLYAYSDRLIEMIQEKIDLKLVTPPNPITLGWVIQLHNIYLALSNAEPFLYGGEEGKNEYLRQIHLSLDTGMWESLDTHASKENEVYLEIDFDEDNFNCDSCSYEENRDKAEVTQVFEVLHFAGKKVYRKQIKETYSLEEKGLTLRKSHFVGDRSLKSGDSEDAEVLLAPQLEKQIGESYLQIRSNGWRGTYPRYR